MQIDGREDGRPVRVGQWPGAVRGAMRGGRLPVSPGVAVGLRDLRAGGQLAVPAGGQLAALESPGTQHAVRVVHGRPAAALALGARPQRAAQVAHTLHCTQHAHATRRNPAGFGSRFLGSFNGWRSRGLVSLSLTAFDRWSQELTATGVYPSKLWISEIVN